MLVLLCTAFFTPDIIPPHNQHNTSTRPNSQSQPDPRTHRPSTSLKMLHARQVVPGAHRSRPCPAALLQQCVPPVAV